MNELITKQELIDNNIKLDKKLILINSSLYEKDAFEYLLNLVTEYQALAFISDTHRIWAHGQYYAGDLFSDKFEYWGSIATLDDEDKIANEIKVIRNKSILKVKGNNSIIVDVSMDNNDDAVLSVGYDINNTVDKSIFTVDEQSYYHLDVNDEGKINVVKYTPINVSISQLPIIEFDNGDTTVSFTLTVTGTEPMSLLDITADTDCIINPYNVDSRKITAIVKNNTTTKFNITYSDGITTKTTAVTQEWGYMVKYGSMLLPVDYNTESVLYDNVIKIPNKYIAKTLTTKTITINQNIQGTAAPYGWILCPSSWRVVFTDVSTNLQGGWESFGKFTYYTSKTQYTIWKTEQSGLGEVKWTISNK